VKENLNYLVVSIGPECLAINSDHIREKVCSSFNGKSKDICLDFSKTLCIDAAGVGVIAAVVFEGRRRGFNITMRGAKGAVLELLTSTGLNRLSLWSD
jgi:anti-anti-sigma factor